MKHIFLLFAVIFLFHNNAFVAQAQNADSTCSKAPKPNTQITFEISIHNMGLDSTINEGEGVSLKCVFKNVSATNQDFRLDDHSADYGTLDYPEDLFAKIVAASGKVTTENKHLCDGWFVSDCGDGRVERVQPEPGDIITLKPGEQVTRIVPLWELFADCRTSPRLKLLPVGKNIVQLRLLNIYSNKLEILVLEKEKP